MKSSLIALALLILELNSIHGHSIRSADRNKHVNARPYSQTDVYEVRDDGASVTFVNPALGGKRSRDIVYYHVVEKPCSEIIPEAPNIPAIRYDSFPASMREFISTEKPETPDIITDRAEEETYESPELETDKQITEIRELETNAEHEIKPLRGGFNGKNIPRDEESGIQTRTYGMKFKSGKGYVWNDFYTLDSNKDDINIMNDDEKHFLKPKLNVKDPKNDIQFENTKKTAPKTDEDRKNVIKNTDEIHKNIAKARKTITARIKQILEHIKRQKNINIKDEKDKDRIKDETEDTMVNSNKDDISDFQEKSRTYGMRLLNGQGYVWNVIFTNPGLSYKIGNTDNPYEIDIRNPLFETSNHIAQQSQNAANQASDTNTDKEGEENENIYLENENMNADMDDIFVHVAKFKQTTPAPDMEDLDIKRHHKDTHKLLIEELLQSDEFWAFVIEWSEMYLDILTKYIKQTVKSEVEKELNAHFSNIEIDHDKTDELNNDDSEEKEEEYLENTSMESQKDTDLEKLQKHTLIIKKDGFIIDGVELPFFNYKGIKYSNEGKLSKRRKVNKKKPTENKTETDNLDSNHNNGKKDNINAKNDSRVINVENVYGNNVGNEKVSNVFVFYPNEGLDKVLEKLKPIAGENGVFLIKPDKAEDKNEELIHPETAAEIGEVLSENEKEDSTNPELTNGENPDFDQKPEEKGPENVEENGPEKDKIQPGTDDTKEKEDNDKNDDVELDTRRFR